MLCSTELLLSNILLGQKLHLIKCGQLVIYVSNAVFSNATSIEKGSYWRESRYQQFSVSMLNGAVMFRASIR